MNYLSNKYDSFNLLISFSQFTNLNDSNLIGNIETILIRNKSDVGFLLSSGSDKSIDLEWLNLIKCLNSSSDLSLIGSHINYESEDIVVFDLLHCRLSSQW